MFGGGMGSNKLLGMLALQDAFGALGSIGSQRPYQSRALPLMLAGAQQADQAQRGQAAVEGMLGRAPQVAEGPGAGVAEDAVSRLGMAPRQAQIPPDVASVARSMAAAGDHQGAMRYIGDYHMKMATQAAGDPYKRFRVVGDDLLDLGAEGGPSVAYEGGRNAGSATSPIAKLAQDYRNGLIDRETYDAARAKALRDPNGITIGPDGTVQIGGVAATSTTKTEAIKGRNAYDSIITGLDDYLNLVREGGTALLPGKEKDQLLVARRGLQLQMKELFNLGVLNGPDLTLMDQLLVDATDPTNIALDAAGISNFRERAEINIAQLSKMMNDLVLPKLRSAGLPKSGVEGEASGQITRESLRNMSDDELQSLLRRLEGQ